MQISYNKHRNCKHYLIIQDKAGHRGCVRLRKSHDSAMTFREEIESPSGVIGLMGHDKSMLCLILKTCKYAELEEPCR
jgi:hypothetical protein